MIKNTIFYFENDSNLFRNNYLTLFLGSEKLANNTKKLIINMLLEPISKKYKISNMNVGINVFTHLKHHQEDRYKLISLAFSYGKSPKTYEEENIPLVKNESQLLIINNDIFKTYNIDESKYNNSECLNQLGEIITGIQTVDNINVSNPYEEHQIEPTANDNSNTSRNNSTEAATKVSEKKGIFI